MSKFIVMRGLPGSGKSTLARSIFENSSYTNTYLLSTDFGFHGCGDIFYFCNNSGKITGPNNRSITIDELLKTPYVFDHKNLMRNHDLTYCYFCKLLADSIILNNKDIMIILDNTNTQFKEFNAYISVAKRLGVQVEHRIPETGWAFDVDQCFLKNSHNVPKDVIQRMKDRFEWKRQ